MSEIAAPCDDLVDLWFVARRTAAQLEREVDRELQGRLSTTLARFALLSTVGAQNYEINQQSIADLLGLTKSSVSRQVDAAVRDGQLAASASLASRRENSIGLTDAGRDLVHAGEKLLDSVAAEHLGHVATADLRAAIRTLAAITASPATLHRPFEARSAPTG
jgi:DNA-binding MarR family transcriptional regulator